MLRVLLIVWMIWGWLAGQAVANGTRHAGAAEIETVLHGAGAFPSPASLLRAARPPFPLLHAANPTNDGVRSFVFDPENRLTSVFVPGAWRSDFGYDGLGRRRTATDFTWQGGWAETNQTRYLYDGLQIIQERDSNNVPRITYTRGLDFSGTLAGAGGIGGLLGTSQASTNGWQHYYYHADGSGNVTALFDGQATMQASYLYGPFGRMVAQWGPMAAVNSMQFSSMPTHAASGLSLYPFRAYDPRFQRWANHDPIEERGALNLYQFVGNNPLNHVDPLGLEAGYLYNPDGSLTLPHESIYAQGAVDYWNFLSWLNDQVAESLRYPGNGIAGGEIGRPILGVLENEFAQQFELPLLKPRPRNAGRTAGLLCDTKGNQFPLESGRNGPAQTAPKGPGSGFDLLTSTHVEGHAAALMGQSGMDQGTLYINNSEICPNCARNLPSMLPSGCRLTVVKPDGTTAVFVGK